MSLLRDSPVATCNDAGRSKSGLSINGSSTSGEFQYSQIGSLFRDCSFPHGCDEAATCEVAADFLEACGNKGFALDPVAWLTGRRRTFEPLRRCVVAPTNMCEPCAHHFEQDSNCLC